MTSTASPRAGPSRRALVVVDVQNGVTGTVRSVSSRVRKPADSASSTVALTQWLSASPTTSTSVT